MTNGIFKQTSPGYDAHTGISAQLVQDKYAHAMVGHNVEDVYPSAACNADALEKYPGNSGDPTETGMNIAFNTKLPLFPYFQEHPERLQRFGLAMESLSVPGSLFDAAHVVRSFDWTSLGDATLVDVSSLTFDRGNPTHWYHLDIGWRLKGPYQYGNCRSRSCNDICYPR